MILIVVKNNNFLIEGNVQQLLSDQLCLISRKLFRDGSQTHWQSTQPNHNGSLQAVKREWIHLRVTVCFFATATPLVIQKNTRI